MGREKMGRKGRWFDALQRILTTSEPDHEEKEDKADKKGGRSKEKSNFKKIWQFSKSSSSDPSSSAPPAETAPVARERPPPPPSHSDQQEAEEFEEAKSTETTSEQSDRGYPEAALTSFVDAPAAPAPACATATATPRAPAHSKEELAAIKIQTPCRGYLATRAHQTRGRARLMSLVEGIAVRRQTEEALSCMQAMTRVQTQIYSRRVKMEEDKKALKSQIQVKQGLDKTKIGEGWDHSHQSKEQMESMLAMKQEAASRRQRALSYAFSHHWRNRKPSSGRATPTLHPPMYIDPGCPNWGWSWTERWMAAARPWECQTAPDKDRTPAKSAGRTAAKRKVSISVQIPTTPGRSSVRPPSWQSPRTPTRPWSPSFSARSPAAPPPSPRKGSPLHGSASDLRRTTSLLSERRPRSSQDRLGLGSSSPLHGGKAELSLRRTTSMRSGELPRRLSLGGAAPAGDVDVDDATEETSAPVTPSYMQPTKSVSAKARCASPAAADKVELPQVSSPSVKKRLSLELADRPSVSSPSKVKAENRLPQVSSPSVKKGLSLDLADRPSVSSPSKVKAESRLPQVFSPSMKKRLSLELADRPSVSSPSKVKAERAKRLSQPPSPRL